ncbi:hypothetical protein FH972_019140 [Carpinus fangiana]|uniref:Uncharacterized protein n=1 Tax=Carpinus fangiana TaxID=176857 RepID=A0A5N6RQR3_9ROSI|nr:hypothetical protein FH972_019140 [Carpinus fangiana]
MVATNILSLNHLSSTLQTPKRPPSAVPVPDPLTLLPPIHQISSYTPTSPPSPNLQKPTSSLPQKHKSTKMRDRKREPERWEREAVINFIYFP